MLPRRRSQGSNSASSEKQMDAALKVAMWYLGKGRSLSYTKYPSAQQIQISCGKGSARLSKASFLEVFLTLASNVRCHGRTYHARRTPRTCRVRRVRASDVLLELTSRHPEYLQVGEATIRTSVFRKAPRDAD
jgi:hypothetical protein